MIYRIDPRRSTIEFRARSSVHPITIRSRAPEGEVSLEDGTGRLVIPVGTLRSGQLLQDIELRRQLQVRRYPTIEATLLTMREEADGAHTASGEITFLGVTAPADGALTITPVDEGITVSGTATFDLHDWGYDPPTVLGLRVDSQVTVTIDLFAQ